MRAVFGNPEAADDGLGLKAFTAGADINAVTGDFFVPDRGGSGVFDVAGVNAVIGNQVKISVYKPAVSVIAVLRKGGDKRNGV